MSATDALLWGVVAGAIVVATRIVRLRRGEACEVCADEPATGGADAAGVRTGEGGQRPAEP